MMARTCSKCREMGHNSRTCSSTTTHYHWTQLLKMKERGGNSFRLFGVQLDHHDLSSSSSSSFSQISSNMINRQERWSMDFLPSSTSLRLTSCSSGYEANIGINGYRYQGGLSKCREMGHNSRTCSSTTTHYHWTQLLKMKERGGNSFRLFGVQLDHHDLSSSSSSSFSQISSNMINRQERWSMDFLPSSTSLRLTSCSSGYEANIGINGYRYQGGLQETNFNKGVAWSEEEHRRFVEGIEKLGKGAWKGISKNYVTTRSPTQIASHAQKYFLKLQNTTTVTATIDNLDPNRKRCRRPSLFYVTHVGKDQPVSARELIDINTYNVEASVNNSYECWPADHHSKTLRFDVNSKNSSIQSAAAEGGEPDLELKLAAS